jgi:O-antigen ligase
MNTTGVQETLIQKVVIFLMFLLPIVMGTVPGAVSTINIILLFIALFYALTFWRNLANEEKILCLGMAAFFLAAFLSFINTDDVSKSWARLERLLRVLSFVPIFLLFKKLNLNLVKPLSFGLLIAGPALLLAGNLQTDGGRASGAYNAILFGDFSALTAALLLAYLVSQQTSWKVKVVACISFICAAQAMLMSGTRGAWLGLAASAFLILIFFLKSHSTVRTVRSSLLIFSIAALVIGLTALTNSNINARIQSGYEEFQLYTSGLNPNTSVGLRLQMWEAGVKMWLKNPIIGSGLGDYSLDLAMMIETGESKMPHHFGEAHSLFFEFLGTTGILGFIACSFGLFIYPFWIVAKRLSTHPANLAILGALVVLVCFVFFGISQNWLARLSITSTYVLFLAAMISSFNNETGTGFRVN